MHLHVHFMATAQQQTVAHWKLCAVVVEKAEQLLRTWLTDGFLLQCSIKSLSTTQQSLHDAFSKKDTGADCCALAVHVVLLM